MTARSFLDRALARWDRLGTMTGWFTGCVLMMGGALLIGFVIALYVHHTSRTVQLITLGVGIGAFATWAWMSQPKSR